MSKSKKLLTALLACTACTCIGVGANAMISAYDMPMAIVAADETAKVVPSNVTVYDITEIGMPTVAVAPTYYKCGKMPATENVAVKFNYTFEGADDYVRINIASTSDIDAMGSNQMKLMLYKEFIGFSYKDWDGFVGDNYYINFQHGTTYEFEVGYFDDNDDGKDTWYCKLDGEIVLWYDTANLEDVTLSKGDNFAVFCSFGVHQFATAIKPKAVPDSVTVYDISEVGTASAGVAGVYYNYGSLPTKDNSAVKFNYTFNGTGGDYVRMNIASTSDLDPFGNPQIKLMLFETFMGFSYGDWNEFVGENYEHNFTQGTTYEFEIGNFDDDNDGYDTWYCKVDGEIVLWFDTADKSDISFVKGDYFAIYSAVGVDQIATTIKPVETTVIEMGDVLGEADYEVLNGTKLIDVGVQDNYVVKTRIYLGESYEVMFYLNTDGSGCNGHAFGGGTSFRLKAGTDVMWGWPGAWHITNAGTWFGKVLEANKTYDLEFGVKSIEGSTYNTFVSIDGVVWEFAGTPNEAVFHGGIGTKVGINASKVILEKSTADCDHAFAWTEPDLNDKMEYKCECGIVMDSKVLHTLPENITVYDWDEICTGYTAGATPNTYNAGTIPQKDNVAVEFNYTFTPCGDYVRFNIACTDSTYAFMDNTIKLMMYDDFFGFSYLDWSGFLTDYYYHSLVAGNTYKIQVGCFDDDNDGYDTWYCTIDGEIVLWLNLANHPDLPIAKGDYVAIYTVAGLDKFAPVTEAAQTTLDISDMGVDYMVINGNQAIELGMDKNYTLKTRVYLQPGYELYFFLNTDGTGANGFPYGGATSIRLKDGVEVMWSYPGAWNITNIGTWYGKVLEAGKSYNIEVGMKNVVGNTYSVFISIDGAVWEFKATTSEAVFHGNYGTKLGISAANAVLFEKSTATCEHNVVDANKLVGCQRIGKACSVCNITLDFAWEHDYVSYAAVAPTCEADGNIAYKQCSRCSEMLNADGVVITSAVDAKLGHDYQLQQEVSATCTSAGVAMHYTCSRCDKLFDADEAKTEISAPAAIEQLSHNMTHYDATAATCATAGTIEFWQCAICNKFYSDANGATEVAEADLETALAAHNYGEWIPQIDATVDAEGTLGHYHCNVCGKNFDEDHNEMDSIVIAKLPQQTNEPKDDTPVSSMFGCAGTVSGLSIGVLALGVAGLFLGKKKED